MFELSTNAPRRKGFAGATIGLRRPVSRRFLLPGLSENYCADPELLADAAAAVAALGKKC